jgi:hypothetical protein
MRNLHNALADTLERFHPQLSWRILPDPDINTRWRIEIWRDASRLELEILDLDGEAVGCVLSRANFPFRSMRAFMNTLMDSLDASPHPPGGSPTA